MVDSAERMRRLRERRYKEGRRQLVFWVPEHLTGVVQETVSLLLSNAEADNVRQSDEAALPVGPIVDFEIGPLSAPTSDMMHEGVRNNAKYKDGLHWKGRIKLGRLLALLVKELGVGAPPAAKDAAASSTSSGNKPATQLSMFGEG